MSGDQTRSVHLERVSKARLRATNGRGGSIELGEGADGDAAFTPVELLLVAIGGCTAVDVDYITAKRAEPDAFAVDVTAEKVRDGHGNHLTDIAVTFRITFPGGAAGDAARAILPSAVAKSHERLCTVSRTVELGTRITPRIADAHAAEVQATGLNG